MMNSRRRRRIALHVSKLSSTFSVSRYPIGASFVLNVDKIFIRTDKWSVVLRVSRAMTVITVIANGIVSLSPRQINMISQQVRDLA